MNTRLNQFLSAENISQAQFADRIGVARASVSHILAGRNKPGFDFIERMSRNFPELSLDWLINGKGRMYKDAGSEKSPASVQHEDEKPILRDHEKTESTGLLFDTEEIQSRQEPVFSNMAANADKNDAIRNIIHKSPAIQAAAKSRGSSVRVSKVLVLFSDGSYQELK